MALTDVRSALEQAITDAVVDVDPTVKFAYNNTPFTTPGKTTKYVGMSVNFNASTIQNQGAASSFYRGFVRCDLYVPRGKGSKIFNEISESIITGLTSINASDYVDTYSCKPRVGDVTGPSSIDIEEGSHFLGTITCQFSANA